jgi:hypothetical protein
VPPVPHNRIRTSVQRGRTTTTIGEHAPLLVERAPRPPLPAVVYETGARRQIARLSYTRAQCLLPLPPFATASPFACTSAPLRQMRIRARTRNRDLCLPGGRSAWPGHRRPDVSEVRPGGPRPQPAPPRVWRQRLRARNGVGRRSGRPRAAAASRYSAGKCPGWTTPGPPGRPRNGNWAIGSTLPTRHSSASQQFAICQVAP